MPKLPLTFACGLYDRMLALHTGDVRPDGIDLNYIPMDDARQIFDRMGGGLEFDLSEFSSSEFISRMSKGDDSLVALPVFPSRVFRHGFTFINKKSGIKTPKDLAGKRIGVPLYTMSAAVWARGALQDDNGVDFSNVKWVQGAMNSAGAHGSPSAPPLLKPVSIEQNKSGKSLSQLLSEGAIDATLGAVTPDCFGKNPDIVRLFPDYRAVERDYCKRTKIFPIMHLLAIRRDSYEKNPFIASSLFIAFQRSKEWALHRMRELGTLKYMVPWLGPDIEEIDEVFGGDPFPYGLEPNRPTLTALMKHLHDQGLIKAPIPLEKLFVPVHAQH